MGLHDLNATASLDYALRQCSLIALLRGITPADAAEIGETHFNARFQVIEVRLNSPQPFATIERLAKHMAGRAVIATGTVLTISDVNDVAAAGATAIKLFPAEMASPNGVNACMSGVPKGSQILPVGGLTPETLADWCAEGAVGFGIGSALYKPGFAVEQSVTKR